MRLCPRQMRMLLQRDDHIHPYASGVRTTWNCPLLVHVLPFVAISLCLPTRISVLNSPHHTTTTATRQRKRQENPTIISERHSAMCIHELAKKSVLFVHEFVLKVNIRILELHIKVQILVQIIKICIKNVFRLRFLDTQSCWSDALLEFIVKIVIIERYQFFAFHECRSHCLFGFLVFHFFQIREIQIVKASHEGWLSGV
mmetsp:Transcript_9703/g.36053  ORF Transcript_9703/g.36053 Transcript_9703/m.36053 type:complete len:200 (-) Transcript_9703:3789-4388(-)